MTEQQKREAIEYIEGQLKNGYVDLSSFDEDELEIVKEAIDILKIVDEWNSIGCTSFPIGKINVVNEDGVFITSTDFTDESTNLKVWKALGLQEEDFYKQ